MPWFYIDALDPLGGIGFASLREPDLTAEAVTDNVPNWYIAAPEFEPVPVSSRVIGLAAAAQGNFQLGFTLDGETEIAFPTLAALVEFVRRLYLSGSAGDGPGGVGPDWPIEPPEGGGRPKGLAELTIEEANIRRTLTDFADQMTAASENLSLTEDPLETAKPLDLTVKQSPAALRLSEEAAALTRHAILCVSHAASDLVHGHDDLPEDTLAEMCKSLQVVIHGSCSLHWTSSRRRQQIKTLWDSVAKNLLPFDEVFPDLFGFEVALPPVWSRDPLDLLAALPVPNFVFAGAGKPSWRSLKDLFFSCLASPALLTSRRHSSDRQALFWLAAVVSCQGGQGVPLSLATRRLVKANVRFSANVLTWLGTQMPSHAFAPDLETEIENIGRG